MKNKEQGVTLVSLVVTIVLMLILSGTLITIQTADNAATNLAREKNDQAKILSITEEIKTSLTEEPPETYSDLIIKLKNYGKILNESDPSNAKLITNDGEYTIYVKDIWNINPENVN